MLGHRDAAFLRPPRARGVNRSDADERLPRSVGGLIDFALASYGRYAGLYVLLAIAAFGLEALIEYATPAPALGSPQGQIKVTVLAYTAIFVDAFIIGAVAAGAAARVRGTAVRAPRVLAAGVERWLPLIAIGMIVQSVTDLTSPLSALQALPDPPWLAILTAPLIWLLWGMLSLAPPIAALDGRPIGIAVFDGLWQSLALSLHPANVGRLCFIAFVSILPALLQSLAIDAAMQHHVPRPIFWSEIPIDVLTVGPLAALQTAFALDFARRAGGRLEAPPR